MGTSYRRHGATNCGDLIEHHGGGRDATGTQAGGPKSIIQHTKRSTRAIDASSTTGVQRPGGDAAQGDVRVLYKTLAPRRWIAPQGEGAGALWDRSPFFVTRGKL